MKEIRWAVLGTGWIASEMADILNRNGSPAYAVGSRNYEKAAEFAKKYGIGKVYEDCNDMFTDPDVDAVYVATPHNTHYEYIRKAVLNGKHVLAEKAITLNSEELSEVLSIAKKNKCVVMEAMTIYHMPLYWKLKEIIDSGKLGKVNVITMNFGSFKEYDMNNRFYNMKLAGGAMLDIGVYALSFVRWFMSEKPTRLNSQVKKAPTGVDEQSCLLLGNDDGQMATVMLSLHSKQPKRGMVSCDMGYIEIMEYPRSSKAKIVYAENGASETIEAGETENALLYEIKDVEEAINGVSDRVYLDYTVDVMDIMTSFRKEWDFKYPEEE